MGYKEDIANTFRSALDAVDQAIPDPNVTFAPSDPTVSPATTPHSTTISPNSFVAISGMKPASIWRRLFAFSIDSVVLILAIIILTNIPKVHFRESEIGVFILTLFFLYNIGLQRSSWQATIGQRFLKVRVLKTDGGHAGVFRLFFRYLIGWFSLFSVPLTKGVFILLGIISVLLVIFTNRKQTLHDLLTGTVVVDN